MQASLGSSMKAPAASDLQPQTVPLALLVATFRAHLLEFAPSTMAGAVSPVEDRGSHFALGYSP